VLLYRYRELGEKVGMGKDKVRSLIMELKERGLINPDGGAENA
jgi:DNA-binding IclR family transcriptional regulator